MEKQFNKIGITIPEGYYPERFEMEGDFLMIYLKEKRSKWDRRDLIIKPSPTGRQAGE